MAQLSLPFLVLLASVVTMPPARRTGVPQPVLMTVLGLVMAVVPQIPNVTIDPELILPLVLPPLIFAVARRSSEMIAASRREVLTARGETGADPEIADEVMRGPDLRSGSARLRPLRPAGDGRLNTVRRTRDASPGRVGWPGQAVNGVGPPSPVPPDLAKPSRRALPVTPDPDESRTTRG
ncbi:hypothetical protein [Kitasatospora sp. MAP5-34]|uniref:hypothetical protein n=1 Tax=Kitasatospora sp. MAP5-34 TaxID=3035102 RepID=UPI002473EF7A|nr:hypothetical protein [Kitasatospora sp. MAP5-34]MDH6578830.1 hypothetical protein [Kitasatospora sp. MAP5-34]